MSGEIQSKVFNWIEETAGDSVEPRCTRLRLAHYNAADAQQTLATYELGGIDLQEVKAKVWQTAQHVVQAWNHGIQRFAILAFFGEGEASGAYIPFSLAPQEHEQGPVEIGVTEPANLIGLQKMLMRHCEAKDKIIAGMTLEMMTMQQRTIRATQAELDKVRDRYHDLLHMSEDMILAHDERKLARDQVERQEHRKDQLADKTMLALAPLANQLSVKLGGPKLFANAGTTQDQMLTSMLGSLDDNRFDLLLQCFPDPTHQAVLLEWYKRLVMERREGANGADSDSAKH